MSRPRRVFGLRPVAATSLLLALTLGTLTGCEVADFLAWGMTTYPAEHYAVIIADHGASWPGVGGDESAEEDTLSLAELEPGHSWDYTSLQYLVDTPDADVDDLGRALIEALRPRHRMSRRMRRSLCLWSTSLAWPRWTTHSQPSAPP